MQPPAEHVHWLFATGVLLLGAAPPRRGDRRSRGLAPACLAGISLAVAALRDRRADVARDGPLHQFGDPHARPQRLGTDDDARGRGRARSRQRQAQERAAGDWRRRSRSRSRASAFLIHEANPWLYSRSAFVHHVCGWTLLLGALFPLGAAFKPRSLGVQRRVRRRGDGDRRRALLRSRRGADLRASRSDRRSGAPVRRAALVALAALAFPGSAWAHATLLHTLSRTSASGSARRPGRSGSASTRASASCRTGSRSSTQRGRSSPERRG